MGTMLMGFKLSIVINNTLAEKSVHEDALRAELFAERASKEEFRSAKDRRSGQVFSLKRENEDLIADLEEATTLKEELSASIELLEAELTEVDTLKEGFALRVSSLEEEKTALVADLDEVTALKAEFSSRVSSLEGDKVGLEDERSSRTSRDLHAIFKMQDGFYHRALLAYFSNFEADNESYALEALRLETERLLAAKNHCKTFHYVEGEDKKNIFTWLRFSKVGGTTFQTYLQEMIQEHNLTATGCDYYSNNMVKFGLERTHPFVDFEMCVSVASQVPLPETDVIYGHQAFGNHRIFPARNPVYLVLSRDVAGLQHSYWNYANKHWGMNRTFEDFLEKAPANQNTRYTCGPSFGFYHKTSVCSESNELTLAIALYNLVRVDIIPGWFIGDFERTRDLLAKKWWTGFSRMSKEKKVMPAGIQYTAPKVTANEAAAAELANPLDMRLEVFLSDIYEKQLQCFF